MVDTNTCLNPAAEQVSGYQKLLEWIADGLAARRSESRSLMRVKSGFDGVISGPFGTVEFRGIDLHHEGVGVNVWHRMKPGALVFIHLKTFKMLGFALVRHCTWRGLAGYRIGLEFRCPLMLQGVGNWQFQHVNAAAGSTEQWNKLVEKLSSDPQRP